MVYCTDDFLTVDVKRDRWLEDALTLRFGVTAILENDDPVERYFWDIKRFVRHVVQKAREAGWVDTPDYDYLEEPDGTEHKFVPCNDNPFYCRECGCSETEHRL